jgi:hypothetical protein
MNVYFMVLIVSSVCNMFLESTLLKLQHEISDDRSPVMASTENRVTDPSNKSEIIT